MIVLLLVGLGLILGSFVNALVWRLHAGKDWVRGRSECSHCHHPLKPADLVPVLSWVWLRGRCRYCKKPITDNPLPELILPVLFVVSYLSWPTEQALWPLSFGIWCACLVGFVALAAYDFRWFLLPNSIVFTLIAVAVVYVLIAAYGQRDLQVIGAGLAGVAVTSGIFYVIFQVSKGEWIGGGDVKLGVVLGLLAGGLLEGFLVLFFASILALVATAPQVLRGRAHRKTQVPFGPFLIAGLIIVVLFGADIMHWYSELLYV